MVEADEREGDRRDPSHDQCRRQPGYDDGDETYPKPEQRPAADARRERDDQGKGRRIRHGGLLQPDRNPQQPAGQRGPGPVSGRTTRHRNHPS